jgi:hypothetical protein
MLTHGHGSSNAPQPYPRPWKLRCVVAHACASERKRARDQQPNPHQTHVGNTNPTLPRILSDDAIGQTKKMLREIFDEEEMGDKESGRVKRREERGEREKE